VLGDGRLVVDVTAEASARRFGHRRATFGSRSLGWGPVGLWADQQQGDGIDARSREARAARVEWCHFEERPGPAPPGSDEGNFTIYLTR
jgi:hypothetical protein